MTTKIKSPNEKSHTFLYVLVAVILVGIAVVAYIVMGHQNKEKAEIKDSIQKVSISVEATDSGILLQATESSPSAKKVDLYEDFSCPHCAELAEATDGSMLKQIESGALAVTIHPLNFLDGKVGHSTLAGSATLAVAKAGDAEAYWNLRKMLFEKQREIYSKWTSADDFAKAAKDLGASPAAVKAIKDGTDVEAFKKMAEGDAKRLAKVAGAVSSPQVVYDNKVVNIVNEAGTEYADWPVAIVDGSVRFNKTQGEATDESAAEANK